MAIIKFLLGIVKKKYSRIQLLFFLLIVVVGFLFGDSSIFNRISYNKQIGELNAQIKVYNDMLIKEKDNLSKLQSDKGQIERYAREKYFMRKKDEDIFIVR